MKKTMLTLLAALPALAFAQEKYTIKGKIGTATPATKVFLTYRNDGNNITDSSKVQNGSFTFTGTAPTITLGTLVVDYKGAGLAQMDRKSKADVLPVYLVSGTTVVNSTDSLSKAKVSGTKVNTDYVAYQAFMKPANAKYQDLMAMYSKATKEQRESKEFDDDFEKKYDAVQLEQQNANKAYIQSHGDSYVSLQALSAAGGAYPEYTEMQPLYAKLSPAVQNTKAGKAYAERLNKWKAVALGAQAPEFAQADTNGNVIQLASFKGKYVLVDFWASWCGPCRAENPNVVKAYNKYKGNNFTVLGVSLDRPGAKDKWLKAIHDDQLTWTHVSDLKYWNNEAAQLYGVQAIPQNYLLDPNGKIIAKNIRGEELNQKLADIFGKNDKAKAE
ncbi:TlpA disulfide reductase family protein [Mucilaginibacter koreensis]